MDYDDLVSDAKNTFISRLIDGDENKDAYKIFSEILAKDNEETHAFAALMMQGLLGELYDSERKPLRIDFNQFPEVQKQVEDELDATIKRGIELHAQKYAA